MCKTITIVLLKGLMLTQNDYTMLTAAQKGCKIKYNKCLKEFRVRPNNHWAVICGGKNG